MLYAQCQDNTWHKNIVRLLSSQCQNMSEATLHKNITCAIQAHRYTFAGKLAVSNRSGSLICKCKNDKP